MHIEYIYVVIVSHRICMHVTDILFYYSITRVHRSAELE